MPVQAPEIVETDNTRVACDGGGGALGHPKVFLEMGDENARGMPLLRQALRAEGRRSDASLSALKKGDHLYLVDGSGYLFRAYHALPPLTRKSDGLPVGAVSGFCNMLWKLLEDMKGGDAPTHLAVIFDAGEKTFRNDLYKEYKAHRPPPPEDLVPQFPLVRDATRAFGVPASRWRAIEADDLIATYARMAREAGARVHHHLLRQGPDAAGGATARSNCSTP